MTNQQIFNAKFIIQVMLKVSNKKEILFQKENKFIQIRNSNGVPVGIYLLKVNNRNTRIRCEICSKLTIKTPERRQWRRSGVFIVNFEHASHLVLMVLLLTLTM